MGAWREIEREFYFIFISFFASFSDLRKLDRRFSSGLKAKLIHAKGRSERTVGAWREIEREFYFIFISFFASFSDLRKLDRRFSSGLKAKLIHVARVTRGYQNLGVSSNSTR